MRTRRAVKIMLEFCGLFIVLAGLTWIVANNEALRSRLAYWLNRGNVASSVDAATGQALAEAGDRLVIPKLGVDVPLVVPTSDVTDALLADLESGVVRYPGSSDPGDPGLFFVVGHSSNYAWAPGAYKSVFALLDKLDPGDEVDVAWRGGWYVYRVTASRTVQPHDLSVLDAPSEGTLVRLMTCWPLGTTAQRLVVEATFDAAASQPVVDSSLVVSWGERLAL